MKRKLFTLAAAVSLLLCLATAGLWVRSYWVCDSASFTTHDDARMRQWWMAFDRGYVVIAHFKIGLKEATSRWPNTHYGWGYATTKPASGHVAYGFFFRRDDFIIQLAHWMFAIGFALLPASW